MHSLGRFASALWTTVAGSYTAQYAYMENSDLVAGYDIPVGTNTFSTRKEFELTRIGKSWVLDDNWRRLLALVRTAVMGDE